MIQVRDGSRVLKFKGTLLGKSSSKRGDSLRWIEFELYKTESGSYILSRAGVSVLYHTTTCQLVRRYGLHETSAIELGANSLPCPDCRPKPGDTVVFPEKNRYWAQVSDDPEAVLEALYKYDDSGARYLTNVAQRLLDQASSKDSAIESVYRVEIIP